MDKRTKLFTPGDKVWFEINGKDFDAEVVEDTGGLEVSVYIENVGHMDIYHTILALDE
jgi:threonine dehydrogenase-like Zn-dependent dehydrogenase